MMMQEAANLFWIDMDQLSALDLEVDQIAVKEFQRVYMQVISTGKPSQLMVLGNKEPRSALLD